MFSTDLVNSQPGRYAIVAECILPPLCIFLGGIWLHPTKYAGENVKGRPKPIVFGIVWFLLVSMWTLGLLLVAFNTNDLLSLLLISILSFLAIAMCVLWMYVYKFGSKSNAAQILLLTFVFMLSCTVVSTSSDTPTDSKVLSSLFFGIITSWCGIASMYNYLEINKKE